jgi:hypothetical protein
MPPENNSSAPASAKTSAAPADQSTKAKSLTESQVLTREQHDAKAAVSKTVKELKAELLRSADPRAWMLTHPWATLSAAVVAGFAAASVATPTKEDQALHRLAKLEAALNQNGDSSDNHDDKTRDKKPSSLSKLSGILFQIAQPILASAIAGVTAKMTADPDQQEPPTTAPEQEQEAPTTDPSI